MKRTLFWLLALYICIPHHLLQLLGAGPQLKLFDVFAFGIFLVLLLSSIPASPLYRAFWAFAAWYLIRSAFAVPQIGIDSVLFGMKFVEYFVVCVAVQKMGGKQLQILLLCLVVTMTACMVAELLGVQITLIHWGRLSAQFGGPYELGAISLLLAIAAVSKTSKIVGAVGVVSSVAKASIIGYFVFLARRLGDIRWAVVAVFFGGALALLASDRLGDFFGTSEFFLDKSALQVVYESIPTARNYQDYQDLWLGRAEFASGLPVDASTGLRVYSYVLAVKSLGTLDFLWGKGPGFFTLALDSSLLRVFVESGLLGIILLWRFLARLFSEFALKGMGIAVVLNVLFVDVLFSARFLVVLFILHRVTILAAEQSRHEGRV